MTIRDSRLMIPFQRAIREEEVAQLTLDSLSDPWMIMEEVHDSTDELIEIIESVLGLMALEMEDDDESEQDIVIVGHVQHTTAFILPIREKGIGLYAFTSHGHMCAKPGCLTYWSHPIRADDTPEEYAEAHLCPKCGTEQRDVYKGPWAKPEKP